MKYFWLFMVVIIGVVVAATINLKREYPDLVFSFKTETKKTQPPKYVVVDGKVIPTTILSEEDSKKSCKECHNF